MGILYKLGEVGGSGRHIGALYFNMMPFDELMVHLLLPLLVPLQFLLVVGIRLRLVLRIRLMEFASGLIGVVLLSGLSDDVSLELSIGIVRMAAEGSALLEELEDVDHQTLL
jgi:hypothetical protein